MKPILTIEVTPDGDGVINTSHLSGEQLLDAATYAIVGAVRIVEATWATAHGKASGVNAGQCAINRAGKILNDSEGILRQGKIEVRTKPEGDKQ